MSDFTLTRYDAMRQAIVEAHNIDDVKEIRDKAEALRHYAKQAGESLDNQNKIAEIKIRAERRAGQLLDEMPKATGGQPYQKSTPDTMSGVDPAPTLIDLGISHKQSSRWQSIATIPESIFEQTIAQTMADMEELTSAHMLKVAHDIKRQQMRDEKKQSPPLEGKYRVIYADPPWQYSNSGFDQSAEEHYPTMSIEDLCDLPVGEIADEPCALYMWATVPLMPDAFQVMAAWGFEYKTHRIWVKNKAPGAGWWLRTNHEVLLIGTKNGNAHPNERVESVVMHPVGRHSEKPAVFRQDIERCHDGPRIELFARTRVDGWHCWGNEV